MKIDPKEIFKERAKQLAQELVQESQQEEFLEILEFVLAQERYGIETKFVREVYPLKDLTALPHVPAFIAGLVNVRGHILPVMDVKKFFDLPEKGITDLNKLIVLEGGQLETCILADAIIGTQWIQKDQIQSCPPTLTDLRAEYSAGVTTDRMTILNVKKILSDPKIQIGT